MSRCPTSAELRRFVMDDLSSTQTQDAELARHIDACPSCQRQLDTLTEGPSDLVRRRSQTSGVDDSTITALVLRLSRDPPSLEALNLADGDEVVFPGPPSRGAPLGQLAEYGIVERIAAGANGALFRAIDQTLGRTVALKVLRGAAASSPVARARLLREARAAATIQSEHIVPVLRIGSQPNFPPYLVMAFVEGQSLRERLDHDRVLPPREAATIVRDAARGIVAAHREGLIHRDVKPSNILLDRVSGTARITDFGLARLESETKGLTVEGTIAGTPAYMSVEQITQPQAVDSRTDVYSLGVVLYETLTGEAPFRGVLRMVVAQILHDDPPSPRRRNDAIPWDLEVVCLRAMAKSRDDRYPTAAALVEDLDRWLQGRPILARPIAWWGRVYRWYRRNPVVAGLVTTVGMLALLVVVVSTVSAIRMAALTGVARQAARQATEQRDAALETLGQLVFQVQDEFDKEEINLDALQESVLEIALDGLKNVEPDAEQDRATRLRMGTAERRLAEILARIESPEKAREHFQESVKLLEGLSLVGPSSSLDPEAVKQLIATEASWADHESSIDEPAALAHSQRARDLAERLATGFPSDPQASRLVAESWLHLAEANLANGRFAAAEKDAAEAESRYQADALRQSDDGSSPEGVMEATLLRAMAQRKQGHFDAALETLRRLRDTAEAQAVSRPDLIGHWRFVLGAMQGMSQLHTSRNESELAGEVNRDTVELVARLADAPAGDPAYFEEVQAIFTTLVDQADRFDEPSACRDYQRSLVAFCERWLVKSPRDPLSIQALASARLELAQTLLDLEDSDAAARELAQGLEALEPLTERPGGDCEAVQILVEILLESAELEIDRAQLEVAEKHIQAAISQLEGIRPRDKLFVPALWFAVQRESIEDLRSRLPNGRAIEQK